MKNWLLFSVCCFVIQSGFAQEEAAPYLKTKSLPPFELQLTDNTVFTKAKLKKNTPMIMMFFSPTCDHCVHQTEWMLKRMKDLARYQIVMATFQPIEDLQTFSKKYELNKYSNVVAGRDTRYTLPPFFQIRNFPYLAFYDKTGKLLSVFEGNLEVDAILKRFK